jgi:putative hydrolases of HD superfamily
LSDLERFLTQVGRLKDLPREGWLRHGLTDTESVADHSFRMAILALLLGDSLGVDTRRLLKIALVHDLAECDPSVGDLTPFCGVTREEKQRRERAAMERLCGALPQGDTILALWLDYDEIRSPEADVAHQLDALEMALQAREYQVRHGVDLGEFLDSARAKIRHPALLRLLDGRAPLWQDPDQEPKLLVPDAP